MSITGLLCLLFALVAALLAVLYALQRRDLRSIEQLSQQLQRIAIGGRLPGRVAVDSDKPEVAALVTAVNHVLTRSGAEEPDVAQAPRLFADLGERIHEAVLVHREVILYANRQFASFVGVDRVELIGRRLGDLVPPEYAELVNENIRRRLAGESAAERYEIDMVGLQGQVSRLEIASTVVDYDKGGNLVYRKTAQNFNPTMATAARITIAEVEELVEAGDIPGEQIVTPGSSLRRPRRRPRSNWRSNRSPRPSSPPTSAAASLS